MIRGVALFLFLFGWCWPAFAPAHDFHVSLTEVNFNAKAGTFEVSIRLFTDDLDKAIQLDDRGPTGLITGNETAHIDTRIASYLSRNFRLKVDDRLLSLNFIGKENQLDATWCYLEFAAPSSFASITISNTCLMEVFIDQTNMVTCSAMGKNKSVVLQKGASEKKVVF